VKDLCECCAVADADSTLSPLAIKLVPEYAGLLGARFAATCWYVCRDTKAFADRIRARRAVAAGTATVERTKCRGCSSDATKGGCCAYCFTRLTNAAGEQAK
jgi:hypothetical protein